MVPMSTGGQRDPEDWHDDAVATERAKVSSAGCVWRDHQKHGWQSRTERTIKNATQAHALPSHILWAIVTFSAWSKFIKGQTRRVALPFCISTVMHAGTDFEAIFWHLHLYDIKEDGENRQKEVTPQYDGTFRITALRIHWCLWMLATLSSSQPQKLVLTRGRRQARPNGHKDKPPKSGRQLVLLIPSGYPRNVIMIFSEVIPVHRAQDCTDWEWWRFYFKFVSTRR